MSDIPVGIHNVFPASVPGAAAAPETAVSHDTGPGAEEEEVKVRWEWEGDDGWTQYSAAHNEDITAAFKGKKTEVLLKVCNMLLHVQ